MSKTNDLSSYNPDYYRLIDVVVNEEKTVQVPTTYGQAVHMRLDFYRWRKLLIASGDLENQRIAGAVIVRIEPTRADSDDPATIIYSRHDQSGFGKLLSDVLDEMQEIDINVGE